MVWGRAQAQVVLKSSPVMLRSLLTSSSLHLDRKHQDSQLLFLGMWPGAKKKTVLEKSSEKLHHDARNLSILRWRPGGGVVLPIWFPLIPGHVSHPWQVLGAGSSPLGGPWQGLFKPSPADRPQGSVGPSWLPSHLSPLGGRIPGKLETKEGRCRSPGSLSQSVKAFDKFCSSAAVEKTQEEGDLFVPQKTESSGISSPCPYPTHLAGN